MIYKDVVIWNMINKMFLDSSIEVKNYFIMIL